VELTLELLTLEKESMSSNITQSKEPGHWLPGGLHVLTLLMMSLVKFTRSFT
jgi:hypothetical protein